MYKQELKPSVQRALMISECSITTLDELVNEAIRLDNDLHELALKEEVYTARTRFNEKPNREARHVKQPRPQQNRPNQGQKRFNRNPFQQGFYQARGPEPIHLDTIQQGKPRKEYSNQKFDNKKKTRDYYNCSKPGHLARNYKIKNKVTRQLNVLTRPKEEDPKE
jgi:hypothetical protein